MLYENKFVQDDMNELISRTYIPFELFDNKSILITGANGMLAYYFTCALMHLNIKKKYKIRVVALARNKEKAKENFLSFLNNENFELLSQDVCKSINLKEPIHYILHAAGGASPKLIKNNPVGVISANLQGTINVLEFARKNPIENVLFTSTREVYGGVNGIDWIKETDMGITDPLDSRSCYPESKRMAEQLCESYYLQHGVPFIIARIAHAYGPGMEINRDGRVMSDFISDVVHNKDIILKSEGTIVRAFCYVNDAVAALFTAMLKGVIGESYNIANENEPMTIKDVANMLTTSFPEKNGHVIYKQTIENGEYCQYKRVGLCTKKIEDLGWKPSVRLLDGMKKTVKSFGTI